MDETLVGSTKKIGMMPGAMVYTGEQKVDKVRIRFFDYDAETFREGTCESIDEILDLRDSATTSWINIDGLHDVGLIGRIGEHFGLHRLLLEDIVSPNQRPKLEDYDDCTALVARMLSYDEENERLISEQFTVVLRKNCVLSFQERYGDTFDGVRDRLRKGKGRIRDLGADYLTYALFDSVVDHYFIILEDVAERIEELETEVIESPDRSTVEKIYSLKRDLIYMRKSVWPLREMIGLIDRDEHPLFSAETRRFTRDLYDHTIRVVESVDTFREMATGLLDVYLSSISNRMNEVMRVLTIFASIFIPLTFLAGIYGMNFEYMPELGWKYSYFVLWAIFISVTTGMLYFFRKKDWL